MRQRTIEAIENPQILQFINNPILFGVFLKGGYEDLFSRQLYNVGFSENGDLIPQCQIGNRNRLDIAHLENNQTNSFLEFGHQFSLQFGKESALQKIRDDSKNRLQPEIENAGMLAIQIITDVIELNINEPWIQYFVDRYGINYSIENRQNALNRITEIQGFVDEFNHVHNIDNGHLTKLDIEVENAGRISLNILINGPYNFQIRSSFGAKAR